MTREGRDIGRLIPRIVRPLLAGQCAAPAPETGGVLPTPSFGRQRALQGGRRAACRGRSCCSPVSTERRRRELMCSPVVGKSSSKLALPTRNSSKRLEHECVRHPRSRAVRDSCLHPVLPEVGRLPPLFQSRCTQKPVRRRRVRIAARPVAHTPSSLRGLSPASWPLPVSSPTRL